LLISCSTPPKVAEQNPLESGIMPLDKGAAAYALVDIERARPILDGISYIPLNDKNMKQMLDRTKSAALAVFSPTANDDRRFQLVSWGSYPASGSSIAFGSNKNWEKQKSASKKYDYWHSQRSQMSVAITPSRAFVLVAMTKIPHEPVASSEGVKFPDGFAEFTKNAVFSCWLSDPGLAINQKIRQMGIPLEIPAEQLFVCLFPADSQYEAHVKITLPTATQARTIVSFLSIARAFMPPPAAQQSDGGVRDSTAMMSYLLFSNPVVQEGASLTLKTPPLSVQDISLLFSMFSL